jgi:hypoxanthine phosphoribosyltransferase
MTMVSDADQKYRALEQKTYMTLSEAEELARVLAARISQEAGVPDVVIGLANGANFVTKIVADQLDVPFRMVKVRRKGSRLKRRLRSVIKLLRLPPKILALPFVNFFSKAFDRRYSAIEEQQSPDERSQFAGFAGKRALIIDDCIDTGSSVSYVRKCLKDIGAKEIKTAVICWSNKNDTQKLNSVVPDVFLHRKIHFYPWSNNSPHYRDFVTWSDKAGIPIWN